ncbi:MAG: mechanosensitive ion channel [Bacteroidota bacterium]|nr:mechanosensitive ion channel [Bacteroidota bacterium]
MYREKINHFFEFIIRIFNTHLFNLGRTEVTLWSLLYFFLSLILLVYLSTKLRDLLANRILLKYKIEIGVRQSIAGIIRYTLIFIGLVIIFQTAGIDFTALGFVAGAIGVGIGFGLQEITNNFISGIIILFERPIKVGDRIEVQSSGFRRKNTQFGDAGTRKKDELMKTTIIGDVVKISSRATTVVTNENISILIPNSDLINSSVTNWSHNEDLIRLNLPVHVSHKEDPEVIKNLLLEIVKEIPGVLNSPSSDVLFDEIGDSALQFNLRVWTKQYVHRPNVLKSQIYYSISKTFKENNITVPFPQIDSHIKSW